MENYKWKWKKIKKKKSLMWKIIRFCERKEEKKMRIKKELIKVELPKTKNKKKNCAIIIHDPKQIKKGTQLKWKKLKNSFH